MDKLDIFPLMFAADKVWITELTLNHKNIRSDRNLQAEKYQSVWCQNSDIITNITTPPVRLAAILVRMSVSTFKTAVILHVVCTFIYNSYKIIILLKFDIHKNCILLSLSHFKDVLLLYDCLWLAYMILVPTDMTGELLN